MLLKKICMQHHQKNVINSLDLTIQPGEIFVLMGPSGSGKTTLLKGIAGLLPLASGKITYDRGEGTTGLVFQEPRLFPHMTVLENIAFGLRVKGIPTKERNRQVSRFLKILQLEGLEHRYPHQLSGGQQQRVSLGRSLILKPDLLLLDEPFSSLDTSLRVDLIEWLLAVQKEIGFSILWVTHYVEEAVSAADRIGILIDGTLHQTANPEELFQHPSSERIASFLSLPNRFSREQWQNWFQADLNVFETDDRGWISPNQLLLIDKAEAQDEQAGMISGIVMKTRPGKYGHTITLRSHDALVEVNTIGWGSVPDLNAEISVKVLLDHIHWYSE